MGSSAYTTTVKADTATDAFWIAVSEAREDALWDEDVEFGYEGNIASALSFVMVNIPEGEDAEKMIDKMLDDPDCPFHKWSERAGCVDNKNGTFTFFGWAPE